MNQQELEFFYDPTTYERPAPLAQLAQLRNENAVIWVDEHRLTNWPAGAGFWLVLRHKECLGVMKNAKDFSSHLGGTQMRDPTSVQDLDYVRKMMLNMDPPDHTRLRRLLINAFTSKAITNLESGIQRHARKIVDRMIGEESIGECDFVKDVASDMPLLCLADIFGLPPEDRYLMFDWANRVIGYQDPEYSSSSVFDENTGTFMAREALKQRPVADANGIMPDPRSRTGMSDLYRYAHLLADYKRARPGDDVMSILLKQEDDEFGQVTVEEFENMFWLFSVAGNETLRNAIPGGMIALLENPSIWRGLQRNPDQIDLAVDEMLRWWTPVMNFRRTAARNMELGSVQINAGDKIIVSFLSANHDERVYDNPGVFDPTREPSTHLALGYGPHYCLGAQLAVTQMRALFGELISRIDHIESVGDARFLRSNFQRGVKSLPIRWKKIP